MGGGGRREGNRERGNKGGLWKGKGYKVEAETLLGRDAAGEKQMQTRFVTKPITISDSRKRGKNRKRRIDDCITTKGGSASAVTSLISGC